ncbi:unnamed protein product [Caenorhabditis angaria]|uniref:MATH domain-containing protein n=1 Tax=Caenorhabditis angaria TaxID=860376 RepID=A0A9P1I7I2_9PELO|nr:unnamed protein product [Caenorhabditis angaria]
MNPIVKKANKIAWKVENIDDLNSNGKISEDFVCNGLKWKLKVKTTWTANGTFLSVNLYHENNASNWLTEVECSFKVLDKNGKQLAKKSNLFGVLTNKSNDVGSTRFLKWSNILPSDNSKIDFVIVECEFSFNLYDFSKNPAIFSDAIIKIGSVQLHINKGFYCAYSKILLRDLVKKNESEVTINDVEAEDMVMVLAALLPNPIDITESNYNILMKKNAKHTSKLIFCSDLLEKIGETETPQVKRRRTSIYSQSNQQLNNLIAKLKRGDEFKVLFKHDSFKNLADSTKIPLIQSELQVSLK